VGRERKGVNDDDNGHVDGGAGIGIVERELGKD